MPRISTCMYLTYKLEVHVSIRGGGGIIIIKKKKIFSNLALLYQNLATVNSKYSVTCILGIPL